MLSPTAVQYVGMALYELATNSIKYGALKREGGTVRIAWSTVPDDADSAAFRFEWRESGGSCTYQASAPIRPPTPHTSAPEESAKTWSKKLFPEPPSSARALSSAPRTHSSTAWPP